jgi:hypothetical protein
MDLIERSKVDRRSSGECSHRRDKKSQKNQAA